MLIREGVFWQEGRCAELEQASPGYGIRAPLIKIGAGMVNTADTHENSDEFSLRVCFPSGLVGLKEVHMPVPILMKRR